MYSLYPRMERAPKSTYVLILVDMHILKNTVMQNVVAHLKTYRSNTTGTESVDVYNSVGCVMYEDDIIIDSLYHT